MSIDSWVTIVLAALSVTFYVGVFAQWMKTKKNVENNFVTKSECGLQHALEKERWNQICKQLDKIEKWTDRNPR